MSDGREERAQEEQRRKQEERQNPDNRLDRFPVDPFQPERPDS